MKKYLFLPYFLLISITILGQDKVVRIVPLPKQPDLLIILDGIKLTPEISRDIFAKDNGANIDSVSILQDSIFDCTGQLANIGVVRVFTRDSLNTGAKKILKLTDNWMYKHPLAALEINNKTVSWDANTYNRLINLKPENILSVKVKQPKKHDCNSIIKLKIDG